MNMDPQLLKELVTMKMPFGKYEGIVLANLPVTYIEWFARKGFPAGKLGMLLQTLHVIKTNGLEEILVNLKKMHKP
ncbi:MAG: DUF3820 family protein [Flavobacteriales bacterium]